MSQLLLIPTPRELTVLQPLLEASPHRRDWYIELCGFGPIAAAARTAQLLAIHRPVRVLLLGIAGSYDSSFPLGAAVEFDEVVCHGIGAGIGDSFQTAGDLGWPQWHPPGSAPTIGDQISLDRGDVAALPRAAQLLTCCAAAATDDDVRQRKVKYPRAVAEDMEGYGVAMACELASVPLRMVRGISNMAGDRNHSHWQINPALHAVAKVALTIMARE